MHTKLEVDVYGHWSDNPPIYRIYVNNEMFAERTFGWPSYQNYITEHMYCDLDSGVHTLCLENLDTNSRFEINSFTVDKVSVNKNLLRINGSRIEWRFVVDSLLNSRDPELKNESPAATQVTQVTPVAPQIERPRKVVQVKNYETYIPLVQRARQLNTKK